MCLGIVNGRAAVTVGGEVYSTPWAVPDFEWSHVGFVIEATGTRIYVNERESLVPVVPQLHPDQFTTIGGVAGGNGSARYTGYIDEVRRFLSFCRLHTWLQIQSLT